MGNQNINTKKDLAVAMATGAVIECLVIQETEARTNISDVDNG
jgi:hypothetical protein